MLWENGHIKERVKDLCISEQNKANRLLRYLNLWYMNLVLLVHLVVDSSNLYILTSRPRTSKLYSLNYFTCRLLVIHSLILAIFMEIACCCYWETKIHLDLD